MTVESGRPTWATENVRLRKGSPLSLTCLSRDVSANDVIWISRVLDGQTLTVSENDHLRGSFTRLSRYNVAQSHEDGTTTLTLHVNGTDILTELSIVGLFYINCVKTRIL